MTIPVESLLLLCPTAEETDLLRACLWSGAPARDAWACWQQAVGAPERAIKENVSGVKSLLPLLHDGLHRSGGGADPSLSAALSAAALAETLRYESSATIGTRAFDALAETDVPFLLLKGTALAVTAYPTTTLRHSHDIDVLIRAHDLDRATGALRRAGFVDAERRLGIGTARMRDASGLPLALHDRLYRVPYYTPPLADMWARAQRCDFAGRALLTLSAADHLVHICGHASCAASRDGLKWVADAWYVIERNPHLDWEILLHTVRASRLALPLAMLLHYLAVDLEAPIPVWVLDRLSSAASAADRVAREVALSGLRAGKRGMFRNVIAATHSWHGRVDLLRWMLLPSPTSLRLGEPLRYPKAWPVYYVARPLAYIARRGGRMVLPPR